MSQAKWRIPLSVWYEMPAKTANLNAAYAAGQYACNDSNWWAHGEVAYSWDIPSAYKGIPSPSPLIRWVIDRTVVICGLYMVYGEIGLDSFSFFSQNSGAVGLGELCLIVLELRWRTINNGVDVRERKQSDAIWIRFISIRALCVMQANERDVVRTIKRLKQQNDYDFQK